MKQRPGHDDVVRQTGGTVRHEDIHHHFDTPDWLRPRGFGDEADGLPEQASRERPAESAATAVAAPPAIPHQPAPVHDQPRSLTHTRSRHTSAEIPHEARWKAKHKLRTTLGLLLVPFLAAAVGGGYYAWSIGSMEYIPVAAIPALAIIGIWGAMVNTTPPVTTLKGSKISVRHDGRVDEFDLANPDQAIETTRDPSNPRWKVTLERIDGSQLVLTRKHVPPAEFMTILQHYRTIAAELLEQRIR
ncbi:MAG TPA: hypothetical protein VFR99_00625, partial [Marmoricola sp.]|nr:hypothetical protein [Marmoricola sp.]